MSKIKKYINISNEPVCINIRDFIKELEVIAKGIDNGTYEDIFLETDCERSYGDSIYAVLKIDGVRDESDDEYEKRLSNEKEWKKKQEEKELKEFLRLREKFNGEKNGN